MAVHQKQDSRMPAKAGSKTFIDTAEVRFQWQRAPTEVDALYSLPSTLLRHAPVFGSSTRADWENMLKNKRDGSNPYASPGNYNVSNLYVLSTKSASAKTVFQCASREPPNETPSPGPAYNIEGIWRNGRDKAIGYGFNKDYRKPLIRAATDASYFPQLPKGNASKFGQKLKSGGTLEGAGKRSPGPIYNTAKYDFRTGPSYSFGSSKSSRFQHSVFGNHPPFPPA